jgi:hypothetical protein
VGYVADRLNLEKTAMTIDDINRLEQIQDGLKVDLVGFLNYCHNARYAPGKNSASNMDYVAERASILLKRLEKAI